MSLNQYNFYNPFQNNSIGFLHLGNEKNVNLSIEEVLDELDLYYQPLEKLSIALTFFIIKVIVICVGEVVGIKLLGTMKKEKCLLTDVTKVFVLSQMILHPILISFELPIITIHPINQIVGDWFCLIYWLLWGVLGRIALNNSFIAAAMRYMFIVHDQKVKIYEKENIKRWCLYITIAIPFIEFLLDASLNSPRLSFVKKCYGMDHQIFLSETSTLNVFKSNFYKENVDFDTIQEVGRGIGKLFEISFSVFTHSNITEIFLYYKVFTKMHR